MPFLFRDLGFSNLIFFFFFFFVVPILAFFVRRKWRIAEARKEEVKRLMILASEEAARVELESVECIMVGAQDAVRQLCAICYCPTTTRCSRCKAVRYCSGRCQIIHWRQGHKEECRPPTTAVWSNDLKDSGSNIVLHKDQPGTEHAGLEAEDVSYAKPVQQPHEESAASESISAATVLDGTDGAKIEPSVNLVQADSINVTLSSTSFSTSSDSAECNTRSPVHESPISSYYSISREMPGDISHGASQLRADAVQNQTQLHSCNGSVPVVAAVNTCSSQIKQKISNGISEAVEYESRSDSNSNIMRSDKGSVPEISSAGRPNVTLNSAGTQSDAAHDSPRSIFSDGGDNDESNCGFRFSFNLTRQPSASMLSKCSGPNVLVSDDVRCPILNSGKARASPERSSLIENPLVSTFESSSMIKGRSGENQPLKSSRTVLLSRSASAERAFSGARCSTSIPSSNVDIPMVPISCEATNFTSNGSNSLKTSVRKVVQQFKMSKHHQPGPGSDISGKYKMLFPYDLFVKLYNEKVDLRPIGLSNCGNSCYANAVLQCLTFTRPLTAFLLHGYHRKSCPKKNWCFTCELESLVLQAKEGRSPVSPIRILSQIQSIGSHLGHGKEEDAHEFLRYAIDTMQSVCLKEADINPQTPFSDETTLIQHTFGGYLQSKIKCMKCQGKSERHERMMDLTVEIHGDIGTLDEALERFTATEILDGENKYHCSRCRSYEKAKKRLKILEAPNILTIALKRFQSGKFGKLNKSVRFPENLNLAPYMGGTAGDKLTSYSLYAVVVHLDIMNAAFSGHYVCYVKNLQGKWFKMDDSKVKPVELDSVLKKKAYMLLYARSSPRALNTFWNARRSKWGEATSSFSSGGNISKGMSAGHRPGDYPHWEDHSSGSPNGLCMLPRVDSSSDNSSLLSGSDEGSCSTESTRDSTSTDEYSEYIFGDSGSFNWNSPIRSAEDIDASFSPASRRFSPASSLSTVHELTSQEQLRREVSQGKDGSLFLYSDSNRQTIKLTEHRRHRSNGNVTGWEQLGRMNPFNHRQVGGVSLRRPWGNATQTFY